MELIDAVKQLVATMPDVVVSTKQTNTSVGNKFTTFYINRRGTVLQFVAPYPSTDEKYNEEFLKRIRREL